MPKRYRRLSYAFITGELCASVNLYVAVKLLMRSYNVWRGCMLAESFFLHRVLTVLLLSKSMVFLYFVPHALYILMITDYISNNSKVHLQ